MAEFSNGIPWVSFWELPSKNTLALSGVVDMLSVARSLAAKITEIEQEKITQ
jgi:hypothetical protein